jgi:N6-adenosine-specific RNA methylase IME4
MTTRRVSDLRLHRDSSLVPDMRPHEYTDLLADIRDRGIQVPLDLDGDVVLDGRHRLKAARELGLTTVPVRVVTLNGETATGWLVKAAVLRRHLSDDQRAMMAALYAKAHPKPAQPKAGPGRGKKPAVPVSPRVSGRHPARTEAAQQMNVASARVKKAAEVLKAEPKLAAQVHAGDVKLAQAVRHVKWQEQVARVVSLSKTEGVYDVLVVDPPWHYDRQPADHALRGQCDYLTESLDQLKQRTLPAAEHAVLWLWTTNAFMGEAYELLRAWGFTAKTILTWDKVNMGLGDWLRNVTEHCILAVRGRPVVTLTNQTTLIAEKRREHSRKPEVFYELVESLCPGRKWELFARAERSGWSVEGVESAKFTPSI